MKHGLSMLSIHLLLIVMELIYVPRELKEGRGCLTCETRCRRYE
jgi:hypothetical protein